MNQTKEEVLEIVESNVKRKVGIHAFHKARKLIEQWEQEEKDDKKLWQYTLIGLAMAIVVLVVIVLTEPTKVRVASSKLRSHTSGQH